MIEDKILRQLFNSRAYWGHQKKSRNPQLKKFIYTTINKIDIINLDETILQVEKARFLSLQYAKKDILVISNKDNLTLNGVQIVAKWKPGMLTNFQFGMLSHMPKLLIVDRANYNLIALKEAKLCSIKTIGLCDTNSSLHNIDQFIVINDDSDETIRLVINNVLSN